MVQNDQNPTGHWGFTLAAILAAICIILHHPQVQKPFLMGSKNTIPNGKSITNHPPVMTIFIGGINYIFPNLRGLWHCFTHIITCNWYFGTPMGISMTFPNGSFMALGLPRSIQ